MGKHSKGTPSESDVGYRKPPKDTQFQKGQSGNPRGRPRGARGVKTDLDAELRAQLTITMNGKPLTASKQRLMIMALVTRAATGDVKAAAIVLPLIQQVLGFEDRSKGPTRLSASDEAFLKGLLDDLGGPETDHA